MSTEAGQLCGIGSCGVPRPSLPPYVMLAGLQTGRPPPEGVGLRPGLEPAERLRARSAPEMRPRVISSIRLGGATAALPPTPRRLGAAGDFQARVGAYGQH